jgi:hypothetical protein
MAERSHGNVSGEGHDKLKAKMSERQRKLRQPQRQTDYDIPLLRTEKMAGGYCLLTTNVRRSKDATRSKVLKRA